MAYTAPRLAPPPEPRKPSAAEELFRTMERRLAVLVELTLRDVATRGDAPRRTVCPDPADVEWRNDTNRALAVHGEVLTAGDVGATLTVGGYVIPADVPGGRTDVVLLDANSGVRLACSDPAVRYALRIADPELALRVVADRESGDF